MMKQDFFPVSSCSIDRPLSCLAPLRIHPFLDGELKDIMKRMLCVWGVSTSCRRAQEEDGMKQCAIWSREGSE